MKIAGIVIAHPENNICNRKGCLHQQMHGLIQPLFMQQLLERPARTALNQLAHIGDGLSQTIRQLGQGGRLIVLLYILKRLHSGCALLLIRVGLLDLIRVVHKQHKQQSHGRLVQLPVIDRLIQQ